MLQDRRQKAMFSCIGTERDRLQKECDYARAGSQHASSAKYRGCGWLAASAERLTSESFSLHCRRPDPSQNRDRAQNRCLQLDSALLHFDGVFRLRVSWTKCCSPLSVDFEQRAQDSAEPDAVNRRFLPMEILEFPSHITQIHEYMKT